MQHNRQYRQRVSMSYITGSHAFKTGVDLSEYSEGSPGDANDWNQINGARSYTFRDRIPQQVTIWAVPFEAVWRTRDIGVYVQDQWTLRKLTLNLGVRFNNLNGRAPETEMPAGPWVPARSFPEMKNAPNWTNVNPRLGAAYDLFGNGKTALKASLGRYTPYQIAAVDIPANNQATSTTRTWNDANGNYVPDCDLRNPAAQWRVRALVGPDLRTGSRRQHAPRGRCARRVQPSGLQLAGVGVAAAGAPPERRAERRLFPHLVRRTSWSPTTRRVTAADYDPFCVTVPTDPRLPGGGGNQICGLYDVKPTAFGRVDNLVTQSSNYGEQTEVYNGVDRRRWTRDSAAGAQVGGGVSIGRTVTDTCALNDLPQVLPDTLGAVAVAATAPVVPRTSEFCHITRPWTAATQVKLLAIYPLPWDFQVSATYQNIPGIPIVQAARTRTRRSGRRSAGIWASVAALPPCTANVVIDMVPPGHRYSKTASSRSMSAFTRSFRVASDAHPGNGDFYNLFNAGNVLNMTTRYAGHDRRPVAAADPDSGRADVQVQRPAGLLVEVVVPELVAGGLQASGPER